MNNRKIFLSLLLVILLLIIPTVVNAQSDIIVMLDPGHGGTEPGAQAGGLVERNLTWKLATRVKQILDNTSGITGILTKEYDETLSRYDRAERAKNNDADLLISFHINSNEASNSLSGAEVYITHNTTQKRYYEYSNILGTDILANLRSIGVPSFSYRPKIRVGTPNDVYEDGTVADYYGIISWPMHNGIPSVLIEHCFINNPYDRLNYLNDNMLTKMAEADAKAIIQNKELFRRTYYGKISAQLNSMNLIKGGNGDSYISGTIDINEVIDGTSNKPKDLPLITLKSTDGTVNRKIFSYWMQGMTYYYDTDIDTLDPNKEYYIEAYLTSYENIETNENKTQKVAFKNKELGTGKNGVLSASNNLLQFQYEGATVVTLNTMNVIKSNQQPYVTGTAKVEEYINGKNYNADINQVTFMLEAIDGSFSKKMYSYYQGNGSFYFDINIATLDTQKTYHITAKVDNPNNIAMDTKKEKEISLQGKTTIGTYNELHLEVEGNTFKLTEEYQASIQTKLENITMQDNGAGRHYICGNIQIKENVQGKVMLPTTLPALTLKTEDGFRQKMYIYHSENGSYYFDTYIEDLDIDKQYYVEASLTDQKNLASESQKIQKVSMKDMLLGKIKNHKVEIQNNQLQFIDADKYQGMISTSMQSITLNNNGAGRHYISGYIQIKEITNGIANIPTTLPALTLKTSDGFSQKMYVYHSGNGTYYYDTYVEDLETTEQYYIEAELTNPNNIAESSQKTKTVTLPSKELGKVKDKKVVIQNNQLQFMDADKYQGTIYTSLSSISLNDNGAGRYYICGYIQIKEMINGVTTIPTISPELTLTSEDSFSKKMYLYHSGNGIYYFDTYIDELDASKQYYIQARLTNTNNTASDSEKTQNVAIKNQTLGQTNKNLVSIINGKICLQ